jgi:hypothetical protein
MTRIDPRHRLDTFCTCPSCGLLGHHLIVEQGIFERPWVPGVGGDRIDVSGFGDPLDGTPYVRRRCVFCHHEWNRYDP